MGGRYKNSHRKFVKTHEGKSVAALNRKVNKLARATKPERKHAVFNATPGSVDDGGSIQPLVAIGPGVSDEQRIGNKVKLLRLSARAHIQAVGVSGATVRLIMYRDKNSLVATSLSVLRYAGTGQAIISPYNDDTRQDWTLLMDKTYHVFPGTDKDAITVNISRKLNSTVLWNDSAGLEQGDIKLLAISSHPAGSSSKPLFSVAGQFFYTDV